MQIADSFAISYADDFELGFDIPCGLSHIDCESWSFFEFKFICYMNAVMSGLFLN